jgi:hypothetical protein
VSKNQTKSQTNNQIGFDVYSGALTINNVTILLDVEQAFELRRVFNENLSEG